MPKLLLVWLVTLLAAPALARGQMTQPADATAAVARFLFEGRDVEIMSRWRFGQRELADALIAATSDPRFVGEEKVDGERVQERVPEVWRRIDDLHERRRVAEAVAPRVVDCPARPAGRLAPLVFNTGGETAVWLWRQVVAGRTNIKPAGALGATRYGAGWGNYSDPHRRAVFDLIRDARRSPGYGDAFEALAYLDVDRLARLFVDEGTLGPDHPERDAAVEAALRYTVPADAAEVETYLDARGLEDRHREYVEKLLLLLARADPAAAEARADAIDRALAAEDRGAEVERAWAVAALMGRLEARGANVDCRRYANSTYKDVTVPAVVADVRRVLEAMSDVNSSDIGRYFAERRSAEQGNLDVTALEAVGATATAAALRNIIAAVGPGGFAKHWRDSVQAVRDLGDAEVVRLNATIQSPPEDLLLLLLRYQAAHAAAVRQWRADAEAAEQQEAAREGRSLDRRFADSGVKYYHLSLPPPPAGP